jgi:hypothetical protein
VVRDPSPQQVGRASGLNPAAGEHAVTTDPRELAAVERAGDRSWSAWAYYGRRYGERGRQFTRSDSAWLALLPRSPVATVERQVRWLASVLAARGMPRLLLEDHLRILHQELVAVLPDRAEMYAALLSAAEALAAERQALLADTAMDRLASDFQALIGTSDRHDLRAGTLIAAAVADERAGLPEAVTSLLDWLANPEGFDARWRSAVQETLRRARTTVADAG